VKDAAEQSAQALGGQIDHLMDDAGLYFATALGSSITGVIIDISGWMCLASIIELEGQAAAFPIPMAASGRPEYQAYVL